MRKPQKSNKIIITLCVTACLFRLILSPYLTYERDMASWIGWSERLLEVGFKKFYSFGWCDYLPGHLYILWFLGKVRQFLDGLGLFVSPYVLYKLPAILADVATVYLIYFLVKKWASKKIAILASLVYALNPAVFANSTFWGQIDSINTLFYLLTLITLIRGRLILSSVFLAISCLIKPQGIVLIPLITLILLKQRNWKLFTFHFSLFTFFFISAFLPFAPTIFHFPFSIFHFIFSRFQTALDQYPYTSLNAFNFWAIGKNWWKPDSFAFLGLSYQFWGLLFFGIIYGGCLWVMWKKLEVRDLSLEKKLEVRGEKESKRNLISNFQFPIPISNLQLLISIFAVFFSALFLFPTRVHERHLFSAFPFLLLSTTFIPRLWWVYGWYSVAYVLNLVFAYVWLTSGFREIFSPAIVSALSFLNLVAFVFLVKNVLVALAMIGEVSHDKRTTIVASVSCLRRRGKKDKLWDMSLSDRTKKILLASLFLIAVFTRFFRLSLPQKLVFDEVYHGFTAGEFARGNKEAWEWWTTPPPDVAYEWTHPPLAKLLMAGAIKIVGYNSFGWRFASAVMGVISIMLLYLLAKSLFDNFFIAFVSAFLMTFDFMPFVMSRIAMNDIFFVGFMLGSLWCFVKWLNIRSAKCEVGSGSRNAKWEVGREMRSGKWVAKCEVGSGENTAKEKRTSHLALLTSGILWGCALASKWTALYAVFIFAPFLLWRLKKLIISHQSLIINLLGYFVSFVVVPISVYLLSYLPFFLQNHSWGQFIHLQKQMLWYHTGLKATHPFTSSWWSWPLNLRSVWLFVDYAGDKIANIYCFGNPIIWWTGLIAIFYLVYQLFRRAKNSRFLVLSSLFFVLLGYLAFFLPWSLSPRIMFIYHYFPSLPFLYMALAYTLNEITSYRKNILHITYYILLIICLFVLFYPHLAAVHVPKSFSKFYFWLRSWR